MDYFKRVAALTPTKFWVNNVSREELSWEFQLVPQGVRRTLHMYGKCSIIQRRRSMR